MGRQRKANAKRRDGRTCHICGNSFDRDKARARILPCGHTHCTSCISANMKKNLLQCPSCMRRYKVTEVSDFPDNITLKKYILSEVSSPVAESDNSDKLRPVLGKPSNRALDLSDGMNEILTSMREEIVGNLEKPGVNVEDVKAQYQQYQSLVNDWKIYYKKSTGAYSSISHQLEDVIDCLQEESETVSMTIAGVVREQETLLRAKERIDAALNDIPAIVEAEICSDLVLNCCLQNRSSFLNKELLAQSDLLNKEAQKLQMTYSAETGNTCSSEQRYRPSKKQPEQ